MPNNTPNFNLVNVTYNKRLVKGIFNQQNIMKS